LKTALYRLLAAIVLMTPLIGSAADEKTTTNTTVELQQLRSRIETLEKKMSEINPPLPAAREVPAPAASTLDAIRKAAQDEIDTNTEEPDHHTEFTSGALGLQALPLPGRILEIGTGKGRFLTALLLHVSQATTIDIDPAEQRCARLSVAYAKPPGQARFMIANAENLPWPDHSFDSVVSANALHHMKNIPRVIDEVLRVTRPAGKIALADFNTRGFAIMNKIHREEGRIHECIPYRFKDLIERFAAHGWTAVLRSDDCQAVLIAVKASAGGGGKNRRGQRILKVSLS